MSKKERQQVIALSVLVVIILGALGYMNREAFIPKGTSTISYGGIVRQPIPPLASDALFERTDFQALTGFGDVPIKPGKTGESKLFEPFEE